VTPRPAPGSACWGSVPSPYRDFTASRPDQLWVADLTYVATSEGWLYLATVLDAWSRRIVGWAMGDTLRTDLVVDALNIAVWTWISRLESQFRKRQIAMMLRANAAQPTQARVAPAM
jgi:transposase InsO family protein